MERMECAIDYVTSTTLVGIWQGFFFSPSACVFCDPATVRQRDLQPCLRACVSAASVCGLPCVCVWAMPAALTVDQSVYRSSADQLGPPSVCWRCRLPPAPRTAPPAAATDRRARPVLHHDSGHEEAKHIFILVNLSAESFASWRNKKNLLKKKKNGGKKWIQGSFMTGCMTSRPNLNTPLYYCYFFFFICTWNDSGRA